MRCQADTTSSAICGLRSARVIGMGDFMLACLKVSKLAGMKRLRTVCTCCLLVA